MEKFIVDTILNDALTVAQPETGYRFSMDSILLAAHVENLKNHQVLDIGTGCGIMALILARRFPGIHILGVEIQKELATFACQNVIANHMEKQITIIHNNIIHIQPADVQGEMDVIISNPPYQKQGSSRLNKDPGKAIARHEIHLTIDRLCSACHRLLKSLGKVYLIYPADREHELVTVMNQNHLTPETICFIHTRKNYPAERILITGIKNGRQDCVVVPPRYMSDPHN